MQAVHIYGALCMMFCLQGDVLQSCWFSYKPKAAVRWILRQGDLHDLQAGQAGYSVSKSHIDACICCALASCCLVVGHAHLVNLSGHLLVAQVAHPV